MKSLLFALFYFALFPGNLSILKMDEAIPTFWGSNYRYYEYVKDRDDCHFGYRVSPDTQQVINIFNCTYENEDMFFVLKAMTCATAAHVQYTETCDVTQDLAEENNIPVLGDADCRVVRLGVAPASDNCCKYLLCSDDGLVRLGTRLCPRGRYFSAQTFRCEFMWRDSGKGTISPMTQEEMCPDRPLPANRKRNYGEIMEACSWRWNLREEDSYSVAEPLNCNIRYLCSKYNPDSVSTTYAFTCDSGLYWSNSKQACLQPTDLTLQERRDCVVL